MAKVKRNKAVFKIKAGRLQSRQRFFIAKKDIEIEIYFHFKPIDKFRYFESTKETEELLDHHIDDVIYNMDRHFSFPHESPLPEKVKLLKVTPLQYKKKKLLIEYRLDL